jgi:hypothetical protein
MGEPQSGIQEDKKMLCRGVGAWEREYSETILLVSRGRAGSKQYIFFLLIIGF